MVEDYGIIVYVAVICIAILSVGVALAIFFLRMSIRLEQRIDGRIERLERRVNKLEPRIRRASRQNAKNLRRLAHIEGIVAVGELKAFNNEVRQFRKLTKRRKRKKAKALPKPTPSPEKAESLAEGAC